MIINDEYRQLFPANDALNVWLRAKREEAVRQDQYFKSEQWWTTLSESERARWVAASTNGTVVAAWLAWRAATPSRP